jgi:hypothetical protein
MTITKTWAVAQMDAYPEYEGQADVVFGIHWTLTASEGVHQAQIYGSHNMTLELDEPFTPYSELTEEQVIDWLFAAIGSEQVAAFEANVEQQLQDIINPTVVSPPLPWSGE